MYKCTPTCSVHESRIARAGIQGAPIRGGMTGKPAKPGGVSLLPAPPIVQPHGLGVVRVAPTFATTSRRLSHVAPQKEHSAGSATPRAATVHKVVDVRVRAGQPEPPLRLQGLVTVDH